MAQEI